MVAITIFISFMAFAIIMILHDIFSRKRYDKIVRELNKRIMVFENTKEFGVIFHVKWKFKITRKGVFFIGNELTDSQFQRFLIYSKETKILYTDKSARYYSSLLMMDDIKDFDMTITPCKNLLDGKKVRYCGVDMSLVTPNKIMDKFLSSIEGEELKRASPSTLVTMYTNALCFKHGRFITPADFMDFIIKTERHVNRNIVNILRQRNNRLKYKIRKMKESK